MTNTSPKGTIFEAKEAVDTALEVLEHRRKTPVTVKFNVPSVDKLVKGFRPGDLVFLLARPGHGKTSVLEWLCRQTAQALLKANIPDWEKKVAYFATWEMDIHELVFDALAHATQISVERLSAGDISDAENDKVHDMAFLSDAFPMWYIGNSSNSKVRPQPLTLPRIRDLIWDIKSNRNIHPAMMAFDYLQLITPHTVGDRRNQLIDVTYELKQMAKELGCPIFVAVQAGRGVDNKPWPLPQKADGMECLAADMQLMDAKTGKISSVKDWAVQGEMWIHTMSKEWQVEIAQAKVAQSGQQVVYTVALDNGTELRVSGNHPILTSSGWVETQNLQAGDRTLTVNNVGIEGSKEFEEDLEDIGQARVVSVFKGVMEPTYDLSVPPHHNFILNGVVVHNSAVIEQASDVILGLMKPDDLFGFGTMIGPYGQPDLEVKPNQLVIGLAKYRRGQANRWTCIQWNPATNTLKDWPYNPQIP